MLSSHEFLYAVVDEIAAQQKFSDEEFSVAYGSVSDDLPTLLQTLMFIPSIKSLCTDEQCSNWLPRAMRKEVSHLLCFATVISFPWHSKFDHDYLMVICPVKPSGPRMLCPDRARPWVQHSCPSDNCDLYP